MIAQTFTHKAHIITLSPSTGLFTCLVNRKTLMTESLTGMKKKLDALVEFVPFKALYSGFYTGDAEPITVVGVKNRRFEKVFELSNGREAANVIEDTPANRKLLKTRAALRAAGQERKAIEDKAVAKIDSEITRRKPE